MTPKVKQIMGRHGALVAGVTAALVGAVILLQQILSDFVQWASVVVYMNGQAYSIAGIVPQAFLIAVPFALGFFISLWVVAPIAEELRIPHVVTRAILAAGIGATVSFIVRALIGLLSAFGGGGAWFSNSFVWPTFDFGLAGQQLGGALSGSILLFIAVLPLAVLAGVLLWTWRKEHPPRRPLSGLIDEV